MRTRVVSWSLLVVICALSPPSLARAEDSDAIRRELAEVRRQLDAVREQYETKLRELATRLEQVEARRAAPSPAPPGATSSARASGPSMPTPTPATPAPAPPPAAPAVPAAAPVPGSPAPPALAAEPAPAREPTIREVLSPRQPFALAQPGRALLFDIGVSGDFVTDFTSAAQERKRDGTFAGRENRIFPREIELSLFGRVDPYASAVVRLSAGEESDNGEPSNGEITVKLDEANFTLLALPLGTTARVGMMRPRFGTLNTVHQDDLPQTDRPDVLARFFGEEELDGEKGVEAFWVPPLPFYNEFSVGVFDGDNDVAFGNGSLRDPLVIGRWRTFFELDDWGGLQLDLSAASGLTSDKHRNTILGFGAKYKWAAPGSGFPMLTVAGEALYGMRTVADDTSPSGVTHANRWGAYLYGQYDLSRRWAFGLRGDYTQMPVATGHEWALSPYLQFKPSEFLRFRVQYKHSEGTGSVERVANELFLQGTFILGAHPTERF